MSNRNLAILAVVAAVMVVWAIVQSTGTGTSSVRLSGPSYLIQGLDPADIGKIVIGTGDKAVTLRRTARGFVVANKDDYPVKISELNDLITKCVEIKTLQLYTEDPANHEQLGVTEDKATSIVKFFKNDPNSILLAGVIVGKYRELGEGTYVRLLPGNRVYIASEAPWIKNQPLDYIDRNLVEVDGDKIVSVTVAGPNETYTLKKEKEDGQIILENLPEGKKLKKSDAESVFMALRNLRCEDVQKSSKGLSFDRKYICKLNDAIEYTIRLAQKDNKTYVTCEARFTEPRPTKGRERESEEQLKEKETKLLAYDKAVAFTRRHKGWVYRIANWKSKYLTKKLEDLLEDAPKPKPRQPQKPQEPNAVSAGASPKQPAKQPAGPKPGAEPNQPAASEPNSPAPQDPNQPDTSS